MTGRPVRAGPAVHGIRGPVVVTGTDTGVGKTIVTAAIASAAATAGLRVAVLKPAQTGDESDVDTVRRLAAPALARTLVTYPDPLAPLAAARVAGLAPLTLASVVTAAGELATGHDLVLVEGAGGLLVPMGDADSGFPTGFWTSFWTVADLALALGAPAVVVVRAGLGTLNHTALTLEALARRDLPALVTVGAWPATPELVHRTNLTDLADLSGGLVGVLPEDAGRLPRDQFGASAPSWLAPPLHGHLDAGAFRL
jgi:dethiobiotin synthetase